MYTTKKSISTFKRRGQALEVPLYQQPIEGEHPLAVEDEKNRFYQPQETNTPRK